MSRTRLHTLENPKSPVSEAFRTLRTNIQFSSIDKPINSLVVLLQDQGRKDCIHKHSNCHGTSGKMSF